MKINNKQARGFTLVELLVVIAIIATLAVMATPVILEAMVKAKVVNGKNICVALEGAIDRFESDYSYLPYDPNSSVPESDTSSGNTIRTDSNFMSVLAGVEENVNFKQNRYFETNEPKGSNTSNYKDGMIVEGDRARLYDAWGEAYHILIDYDLDGVMDNPFKSGKEVTGKKALVYSTGPEKKRPTSNATNKVLKHIPSNF